MVLADCNLTAEALEWVFTLADEIPVFVDTVSEFKAGKIKHWLAHIHTLKPTLPELEILWGQAITSDADRNTAVNAFSNCLFICPMSQFIAAKRMENNFC